MIFSDGYLNYTELTEAEFIDESITWANTGLITVVCDDQSQAISDLSVSLITKNSENSIDLRIFDADEDVMIYQQISQNVVDFYTDRIYDYMWKRIGDGEIYPREPPTLNVYSDIEYEFIRKDAVNENYNALFFTSISQYAGPLDRSASQLAYSYTYINLAKLKRETCKMYIYNQDTNLFYDFQTFC